MCSRYTITKDEAKIRIRDAIMTFGFVPRYNVAPGQRASVIVEASKGPELVDMKWGWPRKAGGLQTCSRDDTLRQRLPSYFSQRCLIPADGFYERLSDPNPIRFVRERDEVFCIAGIWRVTEDKPLDEIVVTYDFNIITTEPNHSVAKFHDRMPLVIHQEHYGFWLDGSAEMGLLAMNHPDRDEFLSYRASRALARAGSEGPDLIKNFMRQGDLL